MTRSIKQSIISAENHGARLEAVFRLAVQAYGDEGLAHDFVSELHRGHTAMALGAPDMNTFVDVGALLESAEGTGRTVEYLQGRLVRYRLSDIYKASSAEADAFMDRVHPGFGMTPAEVLQAFGNGYERILSSLDRLDAGGYA